ncbi:hypothetical protein [Flindersiella endophytica]
MPVPYDVLNDLGFDGRVLFNRRETLGLLDEWFPRARPGLRQPDLAFVPWNGLECTLSAGSPDAVAVNVAPPSLLT